MGKWMTIDNKRNLIQQSYIKPEMTQTQLASSPSVPPAKGTRPQHYLGHLKSAAKIMKEEYGKGKRRKPLKVKAPDLEKKLEDWVARAERQGLCLNRKVIRGKLSG
ncbi:hypothetical protein GQ600_18806 [Phytophthora cactorum]|nr:hypothetical protein GQ600_18806 [Phytophthora cactorum]